MGVFRYYWLDFAFTCVGLLFLLLDIGLDAWAVVDLYQEGAHVCLGLLLLFLLGSSALVQAFSWLWYGYDSFKRHTRVEGLPSRTQLGLLHLLQLGIYFRYAGVLEMSVHSFCAERPGPYADYYANYAVYLSHDLSMLRLIEAFSESAPQLALMSAILLRRGQLSPVTVLKALGSASAIAFSVTMYHRSVRSFLPDKKQQSAASSLVYFLWNAALLAARLAALALFASLLPCFVLPHFFCSWLLLFFCAWRAQTAFMNSRGGEWLYRATVGLVWYFNWLNVVEGRTRFRTLLYHGYVLADTALLCALWCWRATGADSERPGFRLSPGQAVGTAVAVVTGYVLGLLLKVAYYRWCHPNVLKEELKGDQEEGSIRERDETDSGGDAAFPVLLKTVQLSVGGPGQPAPPAPQLPRCNKRMRTLAHNFYA